MQAPTVAPVAKAYVTSPLNTPCPVREPTSVIEPQTYKAPDVCASNFVQELTKPVKPVHVDTGSILGASHQKPTTTESVEDTEATEDPHQEGFHESEEPASSGETLEGVMGEREETMPEVGEQPAPVEESPALENGEQDPEKEGAMERATGSEEGEVDSTSASDKEPENEQKAEKSCEDGSQVDKAPAVDSTRQDAVIGFEVEPSEEDKAVVEEPAAPKVWVLHAL